MTPKTKYQIFTPDHIVEKMLDSVNYTNPSVLNKKVLENSCGNGNILIALVKRYLDISIQNNFSLEKIKTQLESNFFGVEKDDLLFKECIKRLNNLCEKYNIFNVNWNIITGDGLTAFKNQKFDFVIGNPPYIRYHNLPNSLRIHLKNRYVSCRKGLFDYYFAFVEQAFNQLAEDGKMVFLLPGSILSTKSGKNLRTLLHDNLTEIHDFKSTKLFKDIDTSSVIVKFAKNNNSQIFKYYINGTEKEYIIRKKENELLFDWRLDLNENITSKNNHLKFGDYFKAMSPVATQANKVFILNDEKIKEYNLEKNALKRAESPRTLKEAREVFIIFPYNIKNNKYEKIDEADFIKYFPNISLYLQNNSEKLMERKFDKNAKWYEYGRSQSINCVFFEKLVLSTTLSKNSKIHKVSKDTVIFGGILIKSISQFDLNIAKRILESENFFKYAQNKGVSINGGYVRINMSLINEYCFGKDELLHGENEI